MKINEIFLSIQGEGQKTGFPCVFIRLFGCNFRCKWCDTTYAVKGKDFKIMSVENIIKEAEKFKIPYFCITGGEPLLQTNEVKKLISRLDGLIEINTNGSLPIWKDEDLRWVIDFKLPSSGMYGRFLWENLTKLTIKDDIIFVIRNRNDYLIAKETVKMMSTFDNLIFNFSPCWGKISKKTLIKWILEDKLNIRLNLQIHKIIWNKNTRGV